MLANHAESVSSDFNKGEKWKLINRNKIAPHFEFHKNSTTMQTKNTQRCQISWAPYPNFGLANFHKNVHTAISSNRWHAGSN